MSFMDFNVYRTKVSILAILVIVALISNIRTSLSQEPIIVGHTCTKIQAIPVFWIEQAKTQFRITYGHTSHGSQIVTGMITLNNTLGCSPLSKSCNDYDCISALYGFCDDYAYYLYGAGNDIAPPGVLSFFDSRMAGDLGHNGDTTWATTTRNHLDGYGNSRNFVMWSWCGGVSDNTEAGINIYLNTMNQLETDYPDVTFIYMTGHLDGGGETGDLHIRNNQIRAYCITNNKILFDFADIESYNPDWDYFLDLNANDGCYYTGGNWADEWCAANPGSDLCAPCSCAHSRALNCNLKGRAFWWMLARIAGWPGPPVTDFNRDGDVDQDDFDVFQMCASGPEVPHNGSETCQQVDFDNDNDIDQDDFGIFQRCFSGEDNLADTDCAN